MQRILLVLLLIVLVACSGATTPTTAPTTAPTDIAQTQPTATQPATGIPATTEPTSAPSKVPATAAPTPEIVFSSDDERWVGRSIYFVMTDRFANGDPANDGADGFGPDLSDPRGWHGGDFQGLIDQLDYIHGMGFDAIWITPVTKQKNKHAFHGYWQYDPYQIDPHLGDMAKLKELVEQAHQRNMLVMLDVVPNHMGDFLPTMQAAPPFNDPTWYHNKGNINNYGNQQEVEQGDLLGLDDLNQENPATRAELLKWIAWLKTETNFDGLRVDTAKHMPKDFLKEFDTAANTFTLGEVFSSDPGYDAPYTQALDSILDYPFYASAKDVFIGTKTIKILQRYFQTYDSTYRNPHVLGTFLDNHDNERFLCIATGGPNDDKQSQLHNALAVMFTVRGIPVVYYGTEQGLSGCKDPANREDLFGKYDTNSATYQWLAKLNEIRKSHPALTRGSTEDRYIDDDGWAFQRTSGEDTVIVCANNSWKPIEFTPTGISNVADGTVLTDALTGNQMSVKSGEMSCNLQPKQVAIWVR